MLFRSGDIAQAMLRDALDAFVKRDTRLAHEVLNEDDRLDSLKTQVFRDLLTYMLKDQSTVEPALDATGAELDLVASELDRRAFEVTVGRLPAEEGDVDLRHLVLAELQVAQAASVVVSRIGLAPVPTTTRSEERRVGKECRSRWSPYH